MPKTRYFELLDHVGIDPEGNPEPLREIGVAINVPTAKDGEIVDVAQRVTIQPIDGTRTFAVDDPLVAGAVLDSGLVREIDPPSKTQARRQREATQDARDKAAQGGDKAAQGGEEE